MATFVRSVGALVSLTLLVVCMSPTVSAQNWASTSTQAYPVQYLQNATLVGALDPSTPMHVVIGLQEQNASQVQPTLRAMLTPGNALYGKPLSVTQFASEFGSMHISMEA